MVEKESGSTSKTIKDFHTLIERKNMKKKHKYGLERSYEMK